MMTPIMMTMQREMIAMLWLDVAMVAVSAGTVAAGCWRMLKRIRAMERRAAQQHGGPWHGGF